MNTTLEAVRAAHDSALTCITTMHERTLEAYRELVAPFVAMLPPWWPQVQEDVARRMIEDASAFALEFIDASTAHALALLGIAPATVTWSPTVPAAPAAPAAPASPAPVATAAPALVALPHDAPSAAGIATATDLTNLTNLTDLTAVTGLTGLPEGAALAPSAALELAATDADVPAVTGSTAPKRPRTTLPGTAPTPPTAGSNGAASKGAPKPGPSKAAPTNAIPPKRTPRSAPPA